uniref:HDC12962 n=1 Tax=Drosophila melanogaster TaxID=7227 RepID=Q6IKB5_DROME|nr:TPA_inf: HDC12962 [Drosophila melanogaster]
MTPKLVPLQKVNISVHVSNAAFVSHAFFRSALNTFPNFLSDLSLKYLMDGGGVIKFRVKMSSTLESLVWLSKFKWPPPRGHNIKHTPCYQRLKHILATHLITQRPKLEKAEAVVPPSTRKWSVPWPPKMRCLTFQLQQQMEASVATRTTIKQQMPCKVSIITCKSLSQTISSIMRPV